MLTWRTGAVGLLVVLRACACQGQTEALDAAPLLHGEPLTVWVLRPGHAPKAPAGVLALLPPTPRLGFQEQTAGSFGQTASSAGQNAASYGTAASNVGTAASNVGQNAGSYGTAPSDAGQNAASYGTAASNYGTAASNVGTAASNVGTAASSYGHLASESGPNTAEERRAAAGAGRNPVLDRVQAMMLKVRDTNIRYVELYAEEFKARVDAANKTGDLPDVLIGSLPATEEYRQLATRLFLPATVYGEIADDNLGAAAQGFAGRWMWRQEFAVFVRAPHPRAARAFALVMAEGSLRLPVQFASDDERSAPALVAIDAVSRLAGGGSGGSGGRPDAGRVHSEAGSGAADGRRDADRGHDDAEDGGAGGFGERASRGGGVAGLGGVGEEPGADASAGGIAAGGGRQLEGAAGVAEPAGGGAARRGSAADAYLDPRRGEQGRRERGDAGLSARRGRGAAATGAVVGQPGRGRAAGGGVADGVWRGLDGHSSLLCGRHLHPAAHARGGAVRIHPRHAVSVAGVERGGEGETKISPWRTFMTGR